jgi:imidazolonepropionase-like amidohydrolase
MAIPSHPAAGRWAYTAARLFDGETVRHAHAVLVDGARIAAVLPVAALPPDVPVTHYPDATLLPGLIDAHTHFMRWMGPHYLAGGVTTVRDVANPLDWICARRAEAADEPWPRLLTTGPALDGPESYWPEISRGCTDLDDARHAVRALAAAGVDAVKLYVRLPAAWIAGMVAAAHDAGLPVLSHPSEAQGLLAVARTGVDECFHLDGLLGDLWPEHPGGWLELWGHDDFPEAAMPQIADAIAAAGAIVTPTLTVWEWFAQTCAGVPLDADDAPDLPGQMLAGPMAQTNLAAVGAWTCAVARAQRFTGMLAERGVDILPGTDVPWTRLSPGRQLWRELGYLTGAGMAPLDVLRAATARAARALRRDDLGRLAPGCRADMIVLDGNPTHRIPLRPVIHEVVRDGRRFTPQQLLAHARQQPDTSRDEPMGRAFTRHYGGG